ncbi:MAG: hypothetical protein IKP09_10260 [Lentisphaeria bacterium]|nr:hypothetical protein [Lentisphaeria bacterium]
MKHYFDTDGTEFRTPPDPYKGRSPMHKRDGSYNDEAFRQMGGTITDDGELSPKETVCAEFALCIADLAKKTDKITSAEFIGVAQNGISSTLISFARVRGVPEDVIAEGRARIVEIMADALRFGVSWSDLITGVTMQA